LFNLQITHEDMKENVSGCFSVHSVLLGKGIISSRSIGPIHLFQFKRVEEMNELNVSLFCPYLLTY